MVLSSTPLSCAVSSSLDKDQIKVVIDEVTRWLDLAEEGDWMTLPGITGTEEAACPACGCWGWSLSHAGVVGCVRSPSWGSWHWLSTRVVTGVR